MTLESSRNEQILADALVYFIGSVPFPLLEGL
jgi:hypothetical protein